MIRTEQGRAFPGRRFDGERFAALLEQHRLNLCDFSRAMEEAGEKPVPPNSLSRYANGKTTPRPRVLAAMERTLRKLGAEPGNLLRKVGQEQLKEAA